MIKTQLIADDLNQLGVTKRVRRKRERERVEEQKRVRGSDDDEEYRCYFS